MRSRILIYNNKYNTIITNDMIKHKYKTVSIKSLYYNLSRKGRLLSGIQTAFIADEVLRKERLAFLQVALEALNLNLSHKSDISPKEFAKSPKIAILGRSYALTEKKQSAE